MLFGDLGTWPPRNFLEALRSYFRLLYCVIQIKIQQLLVFSGDSNEYSIRVSDHSIRIPRSFPSRHWPKVGWPCPFPCSTAYAVVLGLICLNVMQGTLTQESAWVYFIQENIKHQLQYQVLCKWSFSSIGQVDINPKIPPEQCSSAGRYTGISTYMIIEYH